jgi:hypothetical protein
LHQIESKREKMIPGDLSKFRFAYWYFSRGFLQIWNRQIFAELQVFWFNV